MDARADREQELRELLAPRGNPGLMICSDSMDLSKGRVREWIAAIDDSLFLDGDEKNRLIFILFKDLILNVFINCDACSMAGPMYTLLGIKDLAEKRHIEKELLWLYYNMKRAAPQAANFIKRYGHSSHIDRYMGHEPLCPHLDCEPPVDFSMEDMGRFHLMDDYGCLLDGPPVTEILELLR